MTKRKRIGDLVVGLEGQLFPYNPKSASHAKEPVNGLVVELFETTNFGWCVLEIQGERKLYCIG